MSRGLKEIEQDIERKTKDYDSCNTKLAQLEKEKLQLTREKEDFIRDNYCIYLKVNKGTLDVRIKSGLLGFISETGRAVMLNAKGYVSRFEELNALGWKNAYYDENPVKWRDREYYMKDTPAGACLCSRPTGLGGGNTGETFIYNLQKGIPCMNCTDPNIERFSNGTVRIYGG